MVLSSNKGTESVPGLFHFPVSTNQGLGIRGSGNPTVVKIRDHLSEEITGHECDNLAEMFRRRALAGQCVNQPYLGCREFAANVRLITSPSDEPMPCEAANDDLGWMLYDLDFRNADSPAPLFFRARLTSGVLHVPHRDSAEVRG